MKSGYAYKTLSDDTQKCQWGKITKRKKQETIHWKMESSLGPRPSCGTLAVASPRIITTNPDKVSCRKCMSFVLEHIRKNK